MLVIKLVNIMLVIKLVIKYNVGYKVGQYMLVIKLVNKGWLMLVGYKVG